MAFAALGELALLGEPVSASCRGQAAESGQAGQPNDQGGSKATSGLNRASGLALATSPFSNDGSFQTARTSPARIPQLAPRASARTGPCGPCLCLLRSEACGLHRCDRITDIEAGQARNLMA
jgi:hypothetical protein